MSSGAAGDESPLPISVVIPTWRDSEQLAHLLPTVRHLGGIFEIIVVDASTDDATREIVQACDGIYLPSETPNRGAQMNLGGVLARGDVIIFQHADTELTAEHLQSLATAMRDGETIGGAFHRKFDDRHPRLKRLDTIARFLARNGGTLYGDQSIFVRRETFRRLNGFAEIPLMEDMEFSRRLRAAGKTVVLDPPISSSARRHARRGSWRSSIQNGLFIVLYKLGVSPATLHRWYYRDRARSTPVRQTAV